MRPELERLRELGVVARRARRGPAARGRRRRAAGRARPSSSPARSPTRARGEKIPRPTFQRLCERAGATTASSVSANTDLLICGADVGARKTAKAEKLGVEVVDQAEIWQQLIDAGIV